MIKINEGFICSECSGSVPPAKKTCRNHCTYCFMSQHIDGKLPGDRKDVGCGGRMVPISYFIANGTIRIRFFCLSCKKEHQNKIADDDEIGMLDASISRYALEVEQVREVERRGG